MFNLFLNYITVSAGQTKMYAPYFNLGKYLKKSVLFSRADLDRWNYLYERFAVDYIRRFPPSFDANGNAFDFSKTVSPFDPNAAPLTEDETHEYERLKRNLMIEMAQRIGDVFRILEDVPLWLKVEIQDFYTDLDIPTKFLPSMVLKIYGIFDSDEDVDKALKPLLDHLEKVHHEHPKVEVQMSRSPIQDQWRIERVYTLSPDQVLALS